MNSVPAMGSPPTPTAVLDLAMVFGSRLWGHDLPLELVDELADAIAEHARAAAG